MSQTKAQLISGTTAQDLTVDNINTTSINSGQTSGRRNLIINGACLISQRNTSSTSSGYATVDRFSSYQNGLDEAPTYSQGDVSSGTTPYTNGFRKTFKITNGNQTSAGADDHIVMEYRIEDQDIATSGWNYTSTTSNISMSFWVKSSVAQNFYFGFQSDNGSAYRYIMETGNLSANTWTKITKTIPGNSNLVFNNDNGLGMYVNWHLFNGTNRTGTRPLNAWAAADNTTRTPDASSAWYLTDDATFEITGVQIEVSDHATDFEHRSFAQELALCQRYYFRLAEGADHVPICMGAAYTASSIHFGIAHFPCKMRANPTVDAPTASSYYREVANNSTSLASGVQIEDANSTCCGIRITGGSSITQGSAIYFRLGNASAYVAFSAEL